jgi:sugar phosphate isomerase/epimerase
VDLALSTSWNAKNHKDGNSLIREIKNMGFDKVELNFTLTSKMVKDIEQLVKMGEIRVVSLHNYCPLPDWMNPEEASPDFYSLSSLNEDERKKAIEQTKVTIDAAGHLQAQAVVLHMGKVEMQGDFRRLILLYNQGLRESEDYRRLKFEIIKERKRYSDKFLKMALASLEELSGYALKKNIKLGVENRYYFNEVPSLEELDIFFQQLGGRIYYWHDIGHAQNLENLGLYKHDDFLKYSDHMLGVHLHNIVGTRDHRAPLNGEFDFRKLVPYIKGDTLKVMEAHHPATAVQLIESARYLENLFKLCEVKSKLPGR